MHGVPSEGAPLVNEDRNELRRWRVQSLNTDKTRTCDDGWAWFRSKAKLPACQLVRETR